MHSISRLTSILTLMLVLGTPAMGQSLNSTDASTMELVGEARLKVLLWPIYDSRLYTTDGSYSPGQRPLRFEIKYLRDIRAADLVARTEQEWVGLGKSGDLYEEWLDQLAGLWPDISEDDTLVLEIDEQERSTFYFNGRSLGAIDETGFGESFLDIWLSPDTSRPALRSALTGAPTTNR